MGLLLPILSPLLSLQVRLVLDVMIILLDWFGLVWLFLLAAVAINLVLNNYGLPIPCSVDCTKPVIVKATPTKANDCTVRQQLPLAAIAIRTQLQADQQALLCDDSIQHTGPATTPHKAAASNIRIPAFAASYVLWEYSVDGWGMHDCVAWLLQMTPNITHTIPCSEMYLQLRIAALCQSMTTHQWNELAHIFNTITSTVEKEQNHSTADVMTQSQRMTVTPPVITQQKEDASVVVSTKPPTGTDRELWLSTRSVSRTNHMVQSTDTVGPPTHKPTRRMNEGWELPTTPLSMQRRYVVFCTVCCTGISNLAWVRFYHMFLTLLLFFPNKPTNQLAGS